MPQKFFVLDYWLEFGYTVGCSVVKIENNLKFAFFSALLVCELNLSLFGPNTLNFEEQSWMITNKLFTVLSNTKNRISGLDVSTLTTGFFCMNNSLTNGLSKLAWNPFLTTRTPIQYMR